VPELLHQAGPAVELPRLLAAAEEALQQSFSSELPAVVHGHLSSACIEQVGSMTMLLQPTRDLTRYFWTKSELTISPMTALPDFLRLDMRTLGLVASPARRCTGTSTGSSRPFTERPFVCRGPALLAGRPKVTSFPKPGRHPTRGTVCPDLDLTHPPAYRLFWGISPWEVPPSARRGDREVAALIGACSP